MAAENAAFVHLHVHSEFSCWMGTIVYPDCWDACTEQHPAIALTDKGNLFGAIDFYFGAKSKGIHPIIGCEVFFTEDMSVKIKTMERLILLCQNQQGYENLMSYCYRRPCARFLLQSKRLTLIA